MLQPEYFSLSRPLAADLFKLLNQDGALCNMQALYQDAG